MGFFDELGKNLNKVGKKTSEMANVAKLKLEITKNKSAIDKKYEELGSRMYFLNKESLDKDESVDELFVEIDALFINIENLEKEIEELLKENNTVVNTGLVCSNCSAILKENTKFCGSCGAKVEEIQKVDEIKEVDVVETVSNKCPNCGVEVGDAKFCNSCGTSIE